jgi:hypothetical protein
MYSTLEPARIIASLDLLTRRIEERFPGAGLAHVSAELSDIASQTSARVAKIAKPAIFTRAAIMVLVLTGAATLGFLGYKILSNTKTNDDLFGTLQGIDAGFNIIVLMGAVLYFMFSLEERQKRARALKALHELRSVVHVIDMHQLTKDPASTAHVSSPTPSSPKRDMTAFELNRYLDYCSELLSLTAKIAVLYAQSFPEPVVTEVVNDIERTAASLSHKIWQKIMIIESGIQHQELMAKLSQAHDGNS